MSRRIPSRHRKRRKRVSLTECLSLAERSIARHAEHLAEGYRLTGGALWANACGDFTARFVYRQAASKNTITYTFRGAATK